MISRRKWQGLGGALLGLGMVTGCAVETATRDTVRGSADVARSAQAPAGESGVLRPIRGVDAEEPGSTYPRAAVLAVTPESIESSAERDEPTGDPYEHIASADPAFAAAVRVSRDAYEAGRQAFRGGDIDKARELFDDALDAVADDAFRNEPQAAVLADALTAQVAAYEDLWAESGLGREDEPADPAPLDALATVSLPEVATPSEPQVAKPTSQLVHDMPLTVNNQVLAMLEVYKGRLKDEVTPAFKRSGRFLPMIQEIFRREGVPQDLAWLALVESGFKPTAYSSAAAKGLWQFIRSTGRAYGLGQDYWIDERSDPIKATHAAARHLKDLHARYDDWYLALAAYNAGAGKVDHAIARVGKKDYWAIASTRHLLAETKNYVPAFLATLLIVDDPAKHSFDFTPEMSWSFEEVEVEGPADLQQLASCAGTSLDELRRLNPELRRQVTPGNVPRYGLRIPLGTRKRFDDAYAALPPQERLRHAVHTVKRGETVAGIGRRYGIGASAIMAANGLAGRGALAAGTELRVPLLSEYYPPPNWHDEERRRGKRHGAIHIVRRGETLQGIGQRYGLTVAELRRWNGVRGNGRVRAGSRLVVAAGGGGERRKARSGHAVLHHVRRGETVTEIAGRYGVSVHDLARWNGNRVVSFLQAGQKLKVFVRPSAIR